MTIRFTCACSKSYEVSDSYAGKTIRCKNCQQPVRIPSAASDPLTGAAVQPTETFDSSYDNRIKFAAARIAPPRKPIPYSAEAQRLRARHVKNEQGQGFSAANPGLLRPSLLKYFWNFPYSLMLRLGLTFVFVAISLFTCIGIPFALIAAYFTYRHVKSIQDKFISGCICPAKILSIDPPVLAVYADLSIGKNSCKAIRLMEQPLHLLDPKMAQIGNRVSTICYFFGMYPGLSEHWFTPLPTIPHFVSNNQVELHRIHESISDEEWRALEMGLKQLPPQPPLRTYRIIRPDFRPTLRIANAFELSTLSQKYMTEGYGMFGAQITDEVMEKASKYLPQPIERSKVISMSGPYGTGVLITMGGLIFFFSNETQKPIIVPWNSIKVAYANLEFLEIITTANQRTLVPTDGCGIRTMVQLEKLINEAVGVGPND
jgi:hypothetical protein